MKNKLTRKERQFHDDVENAKDYIAYENVRVYANTDIPITPVRKKDGMPTPAEIWKDFDPRAEFLDVTTLSESAAVRRHTFCATHRADGNLTVDLKVYIPAYDSPKAVLLIGEYAALPQAGVIDALTKRGCYVFVADYNGLESDTATAFPPSLSYGRRGNEGDRLTKPGLPAKDTCQYLYTLIERRCAFFAEEIYDKKELVAIGVRTGAEIAMQTAGLEREKIIALGCICGIGYIEYKDIPKYGENAVSTDDATLERLIGVSGIAYIRNYANPLFVALGSNGTISDVDRLSNLNALVKGDFSATIAPQSADNIDAAAFSNFLSRLDAVFCRSSFPKTPETNIEVNTDGTVYADVKADKPIQIKQAVLHYSYNNIDHKTRFWRQVICETTGIAQYLAKFEFERPCASLFYYTEIHYANGTSVTETVEISRYVRLPDTACPAKEQRRSLPARRGRRFLRSQRRRGTARKRHFRSLRARGRKRRAL
jgi:hypothetical protein